MLPKKLPNGLLVEARAAAQEAGHLSRVHFCRQQPQGLQSLPNLETQLMTRSGCVFTRVTTTITGIVRLTCCYDYDYSTHAVSTTSIHQHYQCHDHYPTISHLAVMLSTGNIVGV